MFSGILRAVSKRLLLTTAEKSVPFFRHHFGSISSRSRTAHRFHASDLSYRSKHTLSTAYMETSAPSDALEKLAIGEKTGFSRSAKGKAKHVGGSKQAPGKGRPSTSTKLRGMEKDLPEVRLSKTLSWLLRHGAASEGLPIRKDGYVRVTDLFEYPRLKAQGLNLELLKGMVKADSKQRYDLILEAPEGSVGSKAEKATSGAPSADNTTDGIWWIKARQGHSIKTVQLELKSVASVSDIPSSMAIHGTNKAAWRIIAKEGLSKMKRNHIHLAQHVSGQENISGMRSSAQILIYVAVQKALDTGIKFWLSDNGVVLTEGDERGYLPPEFFEKVVDALTGVELADY